MTSFAGSELTLLARTGGSNWHATYLNWNNFITRRKRAENVTFPNFTKASKNAQLEIKDIQKPPREKFI